MTATSLTRQRWVPQSHTHFYFHIDFHIHYFSETLTLSCHWHLPFLPCSSANSLPSLSCPPSRMEYTSEVCILRELVGTRRTPVWWKLNPCRWSVPCPPSTSNLWKNARSQPRVSCSRPSAMDILTPVIFLSSVFDCIFYYLWFTVFFSLYVVCEVIPCGFAVSILSL